LIRRTGLRSNGWIVSAENQQPTDETALKRGVRLKRIGAVVLALGIAGAGFVYWHGTRSADFSGDPSMARFNRAQAHQMGVMYGKSGQMVDDLVDALKNPDVQAGLIAAISVLFALSCFYLSSSSAHNLVGAHPADAAGPTSTPGREEE
jgi:hypothetical protein